MTLLEILTRLDALLTAAPYTYVATKEPFGFDLQPQQKLHRAYCVVADEPRIDGYIGLHQGEIVEITIRLARKTQRDANAAYLALLADVALLQSAIARDGLAGDYNADVRTWRVPPPAADEDFVIGEIVATVDYEHSL